MRKPYQNILKNISLRTRKKNLHKVSLVSIKKNLKKSSVSIT